MPKRKTARAADENVCINTRRTPQPRPQPPPLSEVDQIRRDVEFALTRQPGQECAALDGDGHSVVNVSFFEGSGRGN